MQATLTSHLVNLDPFALSRATTHPFLSAAASSTLSPHKLTTWLAQDRLYALSYTNFIGSLLARLPLPTSADRTSRLPWRVADAFIDALVNIRSELSLFETTARENGIFLDVCSDPEPAIATRCYQDLFAGALAQGRPVLVGLVVLWATEECYLRAWRFARSRILAGSGSGNGEGGDVMQRVFIPNWSSDEFELFVRRLGDLVDEMCKEERVEKGSWEWKECEMAWKQVLWAEERFWPDVEEAEAGR